MVSSTLRDPNEIVELEVYRDGLGCPVSDDNLAILYTYRKTAEGFFEEYILPEFSADPSMNSDVDFDNWLGSHTADETIGFVEYANEHRGVIKYILI